MIRIGIILIYISIFYSCKKSNEFYTIRMDKDQLSRRNILNSNVSNIEIAGTNFGPKNSFYDITELESSKDELILLDSKSPNPFKVFNLADAQTIQSYGTVGSGPNEIPNSEFIKLVNIGNEENLLSYFDFKSKAVYSINKKSSKTLLSWKLPGDLFSAQCILSLPDSSYIVADLESQSELHIISKNTRSSQPVKGFLNNILDHGMYEKQTFSPRDLVKNAEFIASTNNYLNEVKIYNLEGHYVQSFGYGTNENVSESQINREFVYYYNSGFAESSLFALYANMSNTDQLLENLDILELFESQIHIFDISNKTVIRIVLDRLVSSCTYDSERSRFICIDANNEEQPLVEFIIPDHIKLK